MNELVNDVHSRLNPTAVADVLRPRSLDELQAAVRRAVVGRLPLALCGGRHAMGGQQFRARGLLVDTGELARVIAFDREAGLVEAEAGIQWPALIDSLDGSPWTIRQKQAGADGFSLGGSVSANAHGRGLALAPLVADVERLVLVGADGEARTCSRDEHPELFRLVCGGYGLFGAIHSVTLRLGRRRKVEHVVELVQAEELPLLLEERVDAGFAYGDVRLEIDPRSPGYLQRGVFSCSRPVPHDTPLSASSALDDERWGAELRLAHTDKARAFELVAARTLGTSGRVDWSDRHQLAGYALGHHWPGSSEMTTELFVPRPALTAFLADAARELRTRESDVVRAALRFAEQDEETVLTWARGPTACIELDLHVEHDAVSVGRAADVFRALIDVALGYGGTYYLTYHRWARSDQLEAAHPRIHEFIHAKRVHDPAEVFTSDWYRHVLGLLNVREAA